MGLEISNFIPDTFITWIEWGEGSRFKIQYVGADEAEAALLERAQKANVRTQNATAKDRADMMTDFLADAVLLDWEGLTLDGKAFPYSKENAKMLLSKARDIREYIHGEASKVTNFKEYDDLKNSASGEKTD